MEINNLINLIKKRLSKISYDEVYIEDKTYLHTKHKNFDKTKFHLKITIKSKQLKQKKTIDANRIIFSLLKNEIKNYIHSIQILIN